ncbi:MAG: MBL fold metallo-hydrolase [Planctomycetaceae bacterium]|nr:MBL fold metallo-hydrolase [Planctomycetaceae bacterium]
MQRLFLLVMVAVAALAGALGAVEMKHYAWDGMDVYALADVDRDPNAANKPELLIGLTDAEKAALPAGIMANSVNCFVVKMGKDVLLFDTGYGGARGHLVRSMAEAGFKPEDITAVIITHFHPDHIGGLLNSEGGAAFPNARLVVSRVEVEAFPQAAMEFAGGYSGGLVTFEWDQAVSDGVTARNASGHTPGHTVFEIDGGSAKLLILADLIHFAGIQLQRPEVAVTYDSDPSAAVAARKRIFDYAAESGTTVAGMHLPFPGVGKLSKAGSRYGFAGAE